MSQPRPSSKELRRLLRSTKDWFYECRGKHAAIVHRASGVKLFVSTSASNPDTQIKKLQRQISYVETNGTVPPTRS
jgi:hypothetical protein